MNISLFEKRKLYFFENHIGDRSRESLAEELWGIYLMIRAEHPDIDDRRPDDVWPPNLHLADVLDKYLLQRVSRMRSTEFEP